MRAIALAAALFIAAPACADPAMPEWITGAWLSCADGEDVAEIWTGAGSGLLVGVNHTRSARGAAFEHLRIAPAADGAVTFYGSPQGAPPTPFKLAAQEAQRVVFENAAHDFPQRIIYARDGRVLTARVEGMVNGRLEHMDWRFRPARVGERCARR